MARSAEGREEIKKKEFTVIIVEIEIVPRLGGGGRCKNRGEVMTI